MDSYDGAMAMQYESGVDASRDTLAWITLTNTRTHQADDGCYICTGFPGALLQHIR